MSRIMKADACPLRSARITPKPLIAAEAVFSVLKPRTGRIGCFSLPWSASMTLFKYLTSRCLRLLGAPALPLQLGRSGGIGRRLVGVDDGRLFPILQAVQRLAEEALGRRRVVRRRQVELDGVPVSVNGSIETPTGRSPSRMSRRPARWSNAAEPSGRSLIVDRNAALAQRLLEIAIAHPVAAIPSDRPEHDLTLEVTPLEVRNDPLPCKEPIPT